MRFHEKINELLESGWKDWSDSWYNHGPTKLQAISDVIYNEIVIVCDPDSKKEDVKYQHDGKPVRILNSFTMMDKAKRELKVINSDKNNKFKNIRIVKSAELEKI